MKILARCGRYASPPTTKNRVIPHSSILISENARFSDFLLFEELSSSLWNLIRTPPYLPYISIPYIRLSFNKGNVKEGLPLVE
jgi:hypothetical protein